MAHLDYRIPITRIFLGGPKIRAIGEPPVLTKIQTFHGYLFGFPLNLTELMLYDMFSLYLVISNKTASFHWILGWENQEKPTKYRTNKDTSILWIFVWFSQVFPPLI